MIPMNTKRARVRNTSIQLQISFAYSAPKEVVVREDREYDPVITEVTSGHVRNNTIALFE